MSASVIASTDIQKQLALMRQPTETLLLILRAASKDQSVEMQQLRNKLKKEMMEVESMLAALEFGQDFGLREATEKLQTEYGMSSNPICPTRIELGHISAVLTKQQLHDAQAAQDAVFNMQTSLWMMSNWGRSRDKEFEQVKIELQLERAKRQLAEAENAKLRMEAAAKKEEQNWQWYEH